jgi:hypothetical protein
MPVKEPEHPLHALTTYELNEYLRNLEDALESPVTDAQELSDLRRRLHAVLSEREDRARLAARA